MSSPCELTEPRILLLGVDEEVPRLWIVAVDRVVDRVELQPGGDVAGVQGRGQESCDQVVEGRLCRLLVWVESGLIRAGDRKRMRGLQALDVHEVPQLVGRFDQGVGPAD